MTIRVLIADDQPMVRAGLASLLEGEPDIEVVSLAPDGEAAVSAALSNAVDVVLMDIRMPVLDGLAATRQIAASGSPARVVVLTTFDLDEYVFQAMKAGASGFLLKDATQEELVHAVRSAASGDFLLDPSVTRRVVEAFAGTAAAPPTSAAADEKLGTLTRREREVLALLARGLSNAAIAGQLVVSETTAKTHVSSVLFKLGLRDRVQAVIYAYEQGVVQPGQLRP